MNPKFASLAILKASKYPVDAIVRILEAALKAADPVRAVEQNLDCFQKEIRVGSKTYLLYPDSRILAIAIGKASLAMAEAAQNRIGERLAGGVVVCKHNPSGVSQIGRMHVIQGSHPVPNQSSVEAAERIQTVLRGLTEHDLVLLLISGGGSALVCLPAPGINLQDIQIITSGLLKSGASINELNAVRKHLDLIKGGGLLKMASPAQVAALVISDVVKDPLDVIASGPAVSDPSTFQDAKAILMKYLKKEIIPAAVLERIENGSAGKLPETLKDGDEEAGRVNHTLIASNRASALAALEAAKKAGFDAEVITCELVGEARKTGDELAQLLKNKLAGSKPYMGITGGESTVKVTGQGLGGRNLEVALGAVRGMSGLKNALLITLATDGEDGPTDAAGAFVTGKSLAQGEALGLQPETFLSSNDSYHYFEAMGGLIRTGPSGTNVNDLNFIFKF
jgi:hydroxypyruvate reductase